MKVVVTKEKVTIYKRTYKHNFFRLDVRFMKKELALKFLIFSIKRSKILEITKLFKNLDY